MDRIATNLGSGDLLTHTQHKALVRLDNGQTALCLKSKTVSSWRGEVTTFTVDYPRLPIDMPLSAAFDVWDRYKDR